MSEATSPKPNDQTLQSTDLILSPLMKPKYLFTQKVKLRFQDCEFKITDKIPFEKLSEDQKRQITRNENEEQIPKHYLI